MRHACQAIRLFRYLGIAATYQQVRPFLGAAGKRKAASGANRNVYVFRETNEKAICMTKKRFTKVRPVSIGDRLTASATDQHVWFWESQKGQPQRSCPRWAKAKPQSPAAQSADEPTCRDG